MRRWVILGFSVGAIVAGLLLFSIMTWGPWNDDWSPMDWLMGRPMGYGPLRMNDSPNPGPVPGSMTNGERIVVLEDLRFRPHELTVRRGTTLRFINRDGVRHNVVNVAPGQIGKKSPGFESPLLAPGESWKHTFSESGTYDLVCTIAGHYANGMVGRIIVTE